jgi:transposase InsO family protein
MMGFISGPTIAAPSHHSSSMTLTSPLSEPSITLKTSLIHNGNSHTFMALVDTGADHSFISAKICNQLGLKLIPHQLPCLLANGSQYTTTHYVEALMCINQISLSSPLFVFPSICNHDIILGRFALKKLPLVITLDGKPIFQGFQDLQPPTAAPTHSPGQGIIFKDGTPEEQKEVTQLITEYSSLFFEYSGRYGLFKHHVVDLPTISNQYVAKPPYRVSQDKKAAMKEILDEYIARGLIRHSNSPYAAPAFLVPKRHDPTETAASRKYRLVEDYRAINKLILPDNRPMPCVQDMLDALGQSNAYFCRLDLRQGYHHLPLSADAQKKTAFTTPLGHFEYNVLPYGFKIAPNLFQNAMETILRRHLYVKCLVYIDDIIIFGKNFKTLLQNLRDIFQTLLDAGASLNLTKCEFLAEQTEYLGHLIGRQHSHPTQRHVKAIRNFPQPETVRQMRRFLGLSSFLRRYVPDGHTANERKLRQLIPVDNFPTSPIKWNPETVKIFESMRTAVAEDAALARFDPNAITEVHVDASQTGLGATLFQMQDGHLRAIEHAGRQLTPIEQRYTNTERELLAAVWAVTKKFSIYLEGITFTICTDHKALLGQIKLKETTRRIVHLLLKLEPFSYTFRHIGGADMTVPDALSRSYAAVVSQASGQLLSQPVNHLSVPANQQAIITKTCHEYLGHAGWQKVYAHLRRYLSWKNMRRYISTFVFTCPVCQPRNPASGKVGLPITPITTKAPMEVMGLDIIGPLVPDKQGRKHALVAVDHFSKFAMAHPIARPTGRTASKFVRNVFHQVGKFKEVLTDRGTAFRSKNFRQTLQKLDTFHHMTKRNHFQANGGCERFIRSLKQIQAKLSNDPAKWSSTLPEALACYNRTIHTAHQETPEQIFWDYSDKSNQISPALKILQRQDQYRNGMAKTANRQRQSVVPGDNVFWFPRLASEFKHSADRHYRIRRQGPFQVMAFLPKGEIKVTDGHQERILPGFELKKISPTFFKGGES